MTAWPELCRVRRGMRIWLSMGSSGVSVALLSFRCFRAALPDEAGSRYAKTAFGEVFCQWALLDSNQ